MEEINGQTDSIENPVVSISLENVNDEVINEILQIQSDDKNIIDDIQDEQMKYDMGKKISQFGRNLYQEILSLLKLREREKKQFVKNAKMIYNILVDIKNSIINNKCTHVKVNINYECEDFSSVGSSQNNENNKINNDAVNFSIELFRKHSENNDYEIAICSDNEKPKNVIDNNDKNKNNINKDEENKDNLILMKYSKPIKILGYGLLFLVTHKYFIRCLVYVGIHLFYHAKIEYQSYEYYRYNEKRPNYWRG